MAGPASIMREVHRLRRLARDLREHLERGPRLLKTHQAKVTRQETLLREKQDAIKKLKVSSHEKEVSIKTTQGLMAKYTKQLSESGSKKEYDALQNEIATAKARCQQLEDEALAALTQADEETAKIPDLEKALKLAREEATNFEKGMSARHTELSTQLAETEAKLHAVEATIPANLREQFNRIVASMGADGFSAVENRICSALSHRTDRPESKRTGPRIFPDVQIVWPDLVFARITETLCSIGATVGELFASGKCALRAVR